MVLMFYPRPANKVTTSGPIEKQMVYIRTSSPYSNGSRLSRWRTKFLPTNTNSEDLTTKQKHPEVEALTSGISIRHPIPFPCYSAHNLVASLWGLTKKRKWQTEWGGRPAAGPIRNTHSRVTQIKDRANLTFTTLYISETNPMHAVISYFQ